MMQATPAPLPSNGPPWLAEFLMMPPWWFKAGLLVAAAVCLVVAGRKIASDDFYISDTEQRQMLLIVGTGHAVALGVMVAMDAGLSYFPAVGAGLVGGFALVEILRRCGPILTALTPDETAHIALAWAAIGLTAFLAPSFVDGGRAAQALSIGVGAIAGAMFLWVVLQAQADGETLGEAMREGATDD